MIKELTSDTVVQEELAQLQHDLRANLDLIHDLAKIQTTFSELAATYKEIRQFMPSATSTLGFLQAQVNESIAKVNAETQELYTKAQQFEATHAKSLRELQALFAQEQAQLQQLAQKVQQSSVDLTQQHEVLRTATKHFQQQFEAATQEVQHYQKTLPEFEENLRNQLSMQQADIDRKLRRQNNYLLFLLLLLISLCGYLAAPQLASFIN